MSKPLSIKGRLIREALASNPDKGPKEVAELVNASSEAKAGAVVVKPVDVSQVKQQLARASDAMLGADRPAAPPPAPNTQPPVAPPADAAAHPGATQTVQNGAAPLSWEDLKAVAELVRKIGLERAKEALDRIRELQV